MRVGILTGGGLAPGLNSVISHATSVLKSREHEVIGIPDGWEGMLDVRRDILNLSDMTLRSLRELIRRPGSILGNSRPAIVESNFDRIRRTRVVYGLDGLITIGGDDTLGVARRLHEQIDLPSVGVPKTIDNDIIGTDRTFGFDTAYHQAAERIRKMRTEAEGMRRIAIVEVMGRDAGWITLYAAKAGHADITLIPEFPIEETFLMEKIAAFYNEKNGGDGPQRNAVIAIAEGYIHEGAVPEGTDMDAFGHLKKEGAAKTLASAIKRRLRTVGSGGEIRACVVSDGGTKETHELKTSVEVLGYDVRNGEPVASDAIFAAELGAFAGHLAASGRYGNMVALRGGKITSIPITDVRGGRFVTNEYYDNQHLCMKDIPWYLDETASGIRNDVRSVVD